MRIATLCYLLRDTTENKRQVCLANKKRGFGEGKWNGSGGKFDPKKDATIEDAARREVMEEIGVTLEGLEKVAEVTFRFTSPPGGKVWDQLVHVYIAKEWGGDPIETDEMFPQWFDVENLPLDQMWVSDLHWVPHVLQGKKLRGDFLLDDGTSVISHKEEFVDSF